MAFYVMFGSICHAQEPSAAGVVVLISGEVQLHRGETQSQLVRKEVIKNGDLIVTGSGSRARLRMADGGVVTLGGETQLEIITYDYSEEANSGSALLKLITGALRVVTGAIGMTRDRDFHVESSVGTIGIRGTDFWLGDIFLEALDVIVLSGKGIYIENRAGRVELDTAGYGTTVKGVDTLPAIPGPWSEDKFKAAVKSVSIDDMKY